MVFVSTGGTFRQSETPKEREREREASGIIVSEQVRGAWSGCENVCVFGTASWCVCACVSTAGGFFKLLAANAKKEPEGA